jgi:hypothetical protein
MRTTAALVILVGIATACASTSSTGEPGTAPDAQRIPGTSQAGSEPDAKNENVPANASTAARLGIPPGHLPPPGQCRIWIPGEPPGKQKKQNSAAPCEKLSGDVPSGGWLVYRPGDSKKEVLVREYDGEQELVRVSVFDIVTGELLRTLDPDEAK